MSAQSDPQSAVNRGLGGFSGVPASTLKTWYQDYTAQDGNTIHRRSAVVQAVKSDVLDYEEIEAQVQQLMPMARVIDGFCAKCQHVLDHWPMFPMGTTGVGAVIKQFCTNEVEAAARQGCMFCALLLSGMEDRNVLDMFRKIEVRLRDVGDSGTVSLSTVERVNSHVLWINFPGKKALKFLKPATQGVCFHSDVLPPSGELVPADPLL